MPTSNTDYQKWKRGYEASRKKDKKDFFSRAVFVFGGVFLLSLFIYLWSAGHLQFLGRTTNEVEGTVTKVSDYHIGRGNYVPRLTIEYFHKDKLYTTYENILNSSEVARSTGYSSNDQGEIFVRAFVTYDVDNPDNCRVRLTFE